MVIEWQQLDYNIVELKMMFKRISLIASLLFFLLGTTVFAISNNETSTPNNGHHITQSHTSTIKVSKAPSGKNVTASETTQTPTTELKKAEPKIKDFVVPVVVALFIIIIFGGYWLIFRKKYINR
jgi:cobalamin biosynthesis Mg chelatase CobN